MPKAAFWFVGFALGVSGACSPWGPREVQAAEPQAAPAPPDAPQVVVPPSLRAALPPAAGPEPAQPPPPPDEVADLVEVVARLEDAEAPALVLAAADLERLFRRPERTTSPGLQGDQVALDGVGDGLPERVAVVSEGWFGERFWVCLLEPLAGSWRVAAHVRMDGACRGLPRVDGVVLDGRRWIRVEWTDALSVRARTLALALLEPREGALVPVLRVARDGYRPGGPRSLSVSFQLEGLDLEPLENGVGLRLGYSFSAGADEIGLGSARWAADQVVVRLRQGKPGESFVPFEPAGTRAVDPALFDALATEAWLREHAELTGRLALEGDPAQKLALLELAEGLLDRGGSAEARSLLALLPPRAELEAAAAAAIR